MNEQNDHSLSIARAKPKKRLLLVEDDLDLADVLKALLEWHQFEVLAVHRGVEGLTAVMDSDFDAIVCDMVMPVMSGDMFYFAVQQVKPQLCGRFVFITGYGDDPGVERFLWRTRQPHLFKPLDTNQLVAAISDVIEFGEARALAAAHPQLADAPAALPLAEALEAVAPAPVPVVEIVETPAPLPELPPEPAPEDVPPDEEGKGVRWVG